MSVGGWRPGHRLAPVSRAPGTEGAGRRQVACLPNAPTSQPPAAAAVAETSRSLHPGGGLRLSGRWAGPQSPTRSPRSPAILRSCAAPVRRGPPLSGNGQAAVLPRNTVGCTDPATRMVMRPQQSPAATRPRTPWPEDPGWLRRRNIVPAPSCRKGAVIPCAARHQPCGFPGSPRGQLRSCSPHRPSARGTHHQSQPRTSQPSRSLRRRWDSRRCARRWAPSGPTTTAPAPTPGIADTSMAWAIGLFVGGRVGRSPGTSPDPGDPRVPCTATPHCCDATATPLRWTGPTPGSTLGSRRGSSRRHR